MADTYPNFATLEQHERSGIDYSVLVRRAEPADRKLQGLDPQNNICNRGAVGAGVQLELSRAVRETLFESLTREGRKHPRPRFKAFVDAVARSLEEA